MNQLNVNLPELPYAVSEAMNRLRINIKFCGKNTRKILLTSCLMKVRVPFPPTCGKCLQKQDFPLFW